METKTKAKIKGIVEAYTKMFPQEYQLVTTYIKERRYNHKNEYAELEGDHAIKRALYEIPETLDTMLTQQLSGEELQEFKSKDCKGARWFANTFKEFAIPETL